jgi:outer membrane protein OmpA-like peptidoglycan-associated protein
MRIRKEWAILAVAGALAGCTTTGNENLLGGTAVGALGGAAIGAAVSDNPGEGALIGAGIGALAGGAIGAYMDEQERQLQQIEDVEVERRGNDLVVIAPGDVTFDTDSARIRPGFYSTLDRIADTMVQYPETSITVVGHTDNTGSDGYNMTLSEDRAFAVANYLQQRGVSPNRIQVFGEGESQPIANNSTSEGRSQNRRVELIIRANQA